MALLAIKENVQNDPHEELLELLRQWFFWLQ
jgi:hypothetical protein